MENARHAANSTTATVHNESRSRMLKLQYFIAGLLPLAALAWSPRSRPAPPAQAPPLSYFHLAPAAGVSSLVTPAGTPLRLRALDHVRLIAASAPRTDLAPAYVDQRAAALLAAMEQDGFNAIGGDADAELWHRGLPFIQQLNLSRQIEATQQTPVPDVYAGGFAAAVYALVQTACVPQRRDPELIGYLSDPGLDWDPEAHPERVLRYYLGQSMTAPARQHALAFLRLRYATIAQLNHAWRVHARDFLTLAAPSAAQANAAFRDDARAFGVQVLARYLATVAGSIHTADPHHLYFGAELTLIPNPASALRAAWSIPDVASLALPPAAGGAALAPFVAALAPRPVLIIARGCAPPPPALPGPAGVIGYVWSPDADWQSGACARDTAAWARLNHQ